MLYTIDEIDKLKSLPQFNVALQEIDAILKYIILMEDPDSHLKRTHPDIIKRKKEAARLAGLPTTRAGTLTEYSQGVMLGEDQTVNELTLSYIKLFNNPWLLKYKAVWNLLEKEILDSMDLGERTPKERETISNNIERLTDRLDECEKHIFAGVESDNLRNALFADMERDKAVRLRPEYMAVDLTDKTVDIGANPFHPEIE